MIGSIPFLSSPSLPPFPFLSPSLPPGLPRGEGPLPMLLITHCGLLLVVHRVPLQALNDSQLPQVLFETEHPYPAAALQTRTITFEDGVCWMTLEFDPQCCTGQVEDVLVVWLEAEDGSRSQMAKYNGNDGWPQRSVIVPGRRLVVEMLTATTYQENVDRTDLGKFFGVKLLVTGYSMASVPVGRALAMLERELAYVGGACAAKLLVGDKAAADAVDAAPPASSGSGRVPLRAKRKGKRDAIAKPKSAGDPVAEPKPEKDLLVGHLFANGLRAMHVPSLRDLCTDQRPDTPGDLPAHATPELLFLQDLIEREPKTAGGRFADWIQGPTFVCPASCVRDCIVPTTPGNEDLAVGDTCEFNVHTRDFEGTAIHHPGTEVIVKVSCINDDGTLSELSEDKLVDPSVQWDAQLPVRIVRDDKEGDVFCVSAAPTCNFSPEELRLMHTHARPTDLAVAKPLRPGTFRVSWAPSLAGRFLMSVLVDGEPMRGSPFSYLVAPPPKGLTPAIDMTPAPAPAPSNNADPAIQTFTPDVVLLPASNKFVCLPGIGNSVLRGGPSMESIEVGEVPAAAVIEADGEPVTTDEGLWVKLTAATADVHVIKVRVTDPLSPLVYIDLTIDLWRTISGNPGSYACLASCHSPHSARTRAHCVNRTTSDRELIPTILFATASQLWSSPRI